ncbi:MULTISPECIES: hypothetical protein [unclassified Cupriavidus]|uniref:hypothetical protein n=1 Tax=Cupriavidus sp. TaxID=1873897 RepID=UPI001C008454|nr:MULTISPECIES: hypothetical protein [unclassified Cupriavidus]MCA3191970.1 hypothetical protein [Cupriavidus sp.]MCA3197715.1 hypothetical protein [Cupriavidus sp.]MCA3202767.1 hypothetical protein [Cupriavidus sp.]MCA3207937.1 hypothetical protein [Cupriavidus sp.]QWE96930.1 hypothetical protein KLP38_28350 [Cupriavidus sp. EM10]
MKKGEPQAGIPAAELIDARIAELGDWRAAVLRQVLGYRPGRRLRPLRRIAS